jgi:hypothetical protein
MTGEDDAQLAIDVLRGNPTDEELAALIAVVSEAYTNEAADAVAEAQEHRSAWELAARGLREPLRREYGWGRWTA